MHLGLCVCIILCATIYYLELQHLESISLDAKVHVEKVL